MKNKFDYTTDGYVQAVQYLISVNKEKEIEKDPSPNGHSVIQLANYIYYKNSNCDDCCLNDKCECKK
jgi:hypothetical protein